MNKILVFWLVGLGFSWGAGANEFHEYKEPGFGQTQKSGNLVLLQYHASWCPVCKRQRNSLNKIVGDPAFAKVQFWYADFDTEKDLKSKYGVKTQSTIILFKGDKELYRNVGVTDQVELQSFIKKIVDG